MLAQTEDCRLFIAFCVTVAIQVFWRAGMYCFPTIFFLSLVGFEGLLLGV